jgi:tripartite motif-containing protein 71
MDDRQFDDLSRRIGESPLSRLPRRGLIAALGGATVASVLHLEDELEAKKKNKKKNKNKKCKKEGKKCNKKKCRKKNKKCCCDNLKCKNNVCVSKGGSCPTKVTYENQWGAAGSGENQFNSPWGITYDNNGRVYVTDTNNYRVQIFDAAGGFIEAVGSQGTGNHQFEAPLGIAYNVDGGGNRTLTIADPQQGELKKRLRQYDLDVFWESDIGEGGPSSPHGVTADSNNRIWVVDRSAGAIYLYSRNGGLQANWVPSGAGQLSSPEGIAVYTDSQNGAVYVYVTDTANNRVVKFQYTSNSANGLSFVDAAGSAGSGANQFLNPIGIAADSCGNLWVADRSNNRIQILDKNLNFKSRFTANMSGPNGVAVNGNTLYVVNRNGNNVYRFSLSKN